MGGLLALPAYHPVVRGTAAVASPYGAPGVVRGVMPQPYGTVVPPRPGMVPSPHQPLGTVVAPQGVPTAEDLANASAEKRRALLDRLSRLSPAEIDVLPHQTKVQLLEFLQTLPTSAGSG